MPPGLQLTRTTPEFTDSSVPPGLLRAHHVAAGVWGRVRVLTGELRFVFEDAPGTTHQLRAGDSLDIPPAIAHRVVVLREGRIAGSLDRPVSEADILHLCYETAGLSTTPGASS